MENEKLPENAAHSGMENASAAEDKQAAVQQNDREESRRAVYRETGIIAIGEAIGVALMFAVFALLSRFDCTVLLGGIISMLLTIGNFFIMAVSATLAADKAQAQDVKGGNALMKGSYALRMLAIFVILFACVKSGLCNPIAAILPLAFVQPIITIAEFFRK